MEPSATVLNVLLLARYGVNGASSRVRHYSYIPHLEAHGIRFTVDYLIDDDSLALFYAGRQRRWGRIAAAYARRLTRLRNLSQFDVVWIEKEALPGSPWMLERLFYGGTPTLVDYDDFWVARHQDMPKSGEVKKFRNLIRAADSVTVANRFLAASIHKLSGRLPDVLPNAIDIDMYRKAADRSQTTRASNDVCRIGWIGTPYTAATYLPAIAPLLNRLAGERIAVTRLIGAGDAVPQLVAERVPWTLATEADAVASLDIGIMPLGATTFADGKSGWKLVQCMAAGKPVVATRSGFNADLIADGTTGFLVDDADGFDRCLRQLASDPARRATMGAAAQAAIARQFDRRHLAAELAKILRATALRQSV